MPRTSPFWTEPRDYAGTMPRSLNEIREKAHATIAATGYSSAAEREMAAIVVYLLGELEAAVQDPA